MNIFNRPWREVGLVIFHQSIAQPVIAKRTSGQVLCCMLLLILLVGCQPATQLAQTTTITTAATTIAPTEEVPAAPATANETASTAAAVEATTGNEPAASPPVRLTMPAIDFAATIEPMAWRVTEVDGVRQAVWEIPAVNAGWHINSATPGAAGNMILSGYHLTNGAVFAPLARGEVALGDEFLVTNAAGQSYTYRVSEIATPIPVSGASTAELARVESYFAQSSEAKLTLITGWPDFSDTHYLFVIADLLGEPE